jgi:septal ring factor EnvC (AmiA/AmiB activator)
LEHEQVETELTEARKSLEALKEEIASQTKQLDEAKQQLNVNFKRL